MSQYELAQLNIAVMKEPLESPGMADFVANLERINALAEGSPGFVWRLQTEAGDATALRPMGENTLINFRRAFPAPDAPQPETPFAFGGECPA